MNVASWRVMRGVGLAFALALVAGVVSMSRAAAPPTRPSGAQDFVFLGEARPVLIRMHVRMNGKQVQEAWDFAENSPEPPLEALFEDILVDTTSDSHAQAMAGD